MADITNTIVPLPFDEDGILPENHIIGEPRELPSRNVRAVRPVYGAFFVDSFKMWDANGIPVPPAKLQFCLYSQLISEKTGRTICGGVLLKDVTVPAPVKIEYRAVGGPWGASNEMIIDLFNLIQADDRPVEFGDIIGFPPEGVKGAHHLQDIGDLYGAEYFVAAMDRMADALLMGDKASHDELWRAIQSNGADVDQKIATAMQQQRIYIDQRLAQMNQQLVEMNTRISQLSGGIDNDIEGIERTITQVRADLEQQISNVSDNLRSHAETTNAHGVTAATIGTYDKGEIDRIVSQSGQDLSNYVKKNTAEDLSLTITNGQLMGFVGGTWQTVWPPQWQ